MAKKKQKEKKVKKGHQKKSVQILDNLVTIISFLFPLSALPQIYNIWVLQNVQGVSFLTWFLFLIMQIPLFLYAIVHKEKRMKIMFGLWCTIYLIALSGLIIYR